MREPAIVGAIVLLIVIAPRVHAGDGCSAALENWVELSQARIRKQKTEAGPDRRAPARGACIPTEALRQELLRVLAGVRATCEASAALDQATQQMKALVGINEKFVTSIGLCPVDEPAAQVKASPNSARPPPARPRECLEISRATAGRYVFSNRRCSGTKVLAIIETRGASGEIECKAHTIEERATILAPGKAPPQLNYECALGHPRCTKEHLAVMFPECDW